MKIQMLSGNLGNQIREYAFVRYAERYKPGEVWYFDDSDYFVSKMHPDVPAADYFTSMMPFTYEMEKVFGLRLNLLSKYYDAETWSEIVRQRKMGKRLPQILLDMGQEMGNSIVLFEGRVNQLQVQHRASFDGKIIRPNTEHLGFHPEYLDLPYEHVYYHGEWAKRDWFDAYREENLTELTFPQLPDGKNQEYADMIQGSMSVGIHVRRGDFLTVGRPLTAADYLPVCKAVVKQYPTARFFVFSDDLDWCRGHAAEAGFDLADDTVYVSGNSGSRSYIDMQLLSMCRGMIRNAHSSFSQVAGWLNRNLEFEIKV